MLDEEFALQVLQLHEQPAERDQTLDALLRFCLQAVACDSASVMLVHPKNVIEIAGVTDSTARAADQAQIDTGEGPCLASIAEHEVFRIIDTEQDPRWPAWAQAIHALGIHSVLSARLRDAAGVSVGSLNLYANRCDAFDRDDAAVADVLARHAGIVLGAARHMHDLGQAIDSRKVIGQAQGILMERYNLDADQSFAVLRRYSQHNNLKLRLVAQQVVDTHRLPGE